MIGEGIGNRRVNGERTAHQPIRLFKVASLRRQQPQEMERLELLWIDAQDLLIKRLCFREPPRLMQRERLFDGFGDICPIEYVHRPGLTALLYQLSQP